MITLTEALAAGTCTVADYTREPPGAWPVAAHDDPSLTPCGEPAIALLILACVHEHVDVALACATCAAEIQRIADVLACPRCEDSLAPHDCNAVLTIRLFMGERGDSDIQPDPYIDAIAAEHVQEYEAEDT